MSTLVTGASGFIGGHLVAGLRAQGRSVRCLVRPTSRVESLRPLGCEIVAADFASIESLVPCFDGVEVVYHVAGATRAARREGYFAANEAVTENVFQAITRAKGQGRTAVRRVVHVSSLAAAGPSADGQPIDEDASPAPISTYGLSKLRGEEAARRNQGAVEVTVIRPPVVYGPGDRGVLPFFVLMKRRLSVAVGLGERRLSLVHVSDLISALLLAGEHPGAAGRIYFATDGVAHEWREIMNAIGAAVGKRRLPLVIPEVLVHAAGALVEAAGRLAGRASLFNRDKAREICARHWVCDSSRVERELGFHPRHDLETGIRSTWEWYTHQGWL